LAEGEKAHPTNYCGCRHAKEEMLKKKKRPRGTPKNTSGRLSETRLNNRGNRRKFQAVPSPRSSDTRKEISQF
jgi:hypothetical protein